VNGNIPVVLIRRSTRQETPMIPLPFTTKSSWYEDHWLTDRPTRSAPVRASILAARVLGILVVLVAGLRSLGHH
jgi:hypothetical protein